MTVKEQILDAFTPIQLKSLAMPRDYTLQPGKLKKFLTSKEVRVIPAEERNDILGWSPSVLFPDYEEFYKSIDETVVPDKDYSDMTDGYGVSELFATLRRFIVTEDYLKYIRSTKTNFIINVYGVHSTLISKNFWNFTSNDAGRTKFLNGDIPAYELATPTIRMYTAIGDPIYSDDIYIESCQDAMAVLAKDLPYKYFSEQILPGNVFTWDIGAEKYEVCGKDLSEVNVMIEDIARGGFKEPLVMRINEGCLTPIDNDTTIKLFIATYLHLPTVPAVLYMSEDPEVKNRTYEELHESSHYTHHKNREYLKYVNSVLKPYFNFELAEDYHSQFYLVAGNDFLSKTQYPTMQPESPKVVTYDRYLDTQAEQVVVNTPIAAKDFEIVARAHLREVRETMEAKLSAEAAEHIQKILSGAFD